jgi:hypothetical protein
MKYILLFTICFCFLSCKKNSDSSNNPDKTQTLTSADWKYDNGGIGSSNGTILVDFATVNVIPSCSLDNSVRFNANGTGTVAENTNVCSGAPASSVFSWNFSSNQTALTVSGSAVGGIGGTFTIKELSSTRLTLLKDTTVSGIGATTVIFNLKH